MLVNDEREYVSPMVDKHIDIISFGKHLFPVYASNIRQECLLIKIFHLRSFDHIMAFFYCSIELTDAVYHIMITPRNFMHSRFDDVPGTSCSYMIDYVRGVQSDPGWLFDELIEVEQLIQTSHMSSVIVNALISLFCGEITIRVTKKDYFFP